MAFFNFRATFPRLVSWYNRQFVRLKNMTVMDSSPRPSHTDYLPYYAMVMVKVELSIMLWIINKSLKSKPTSGAGIPWPIKIVVPKTTTKILFQTQIIINWIELQQLPGTVYAQVLKFIFKLKALEVKLDTYFTILYIRLHLVLRVKVITYYDLFLLFLLPTFITKMV